jgi:hypothetical protein
MFTVIRFKLLLAILAIILAQMQPLLSAGSGGNTINGDCASTSAGSCGG